MTEVVVLTDKPVNPRQFAYQLGQRLGMYLAPLRIVGPEPDGTTKIKSDEVSEAEIRAALDAHTPDDNFVLPPNPDAPPPPPDSEEEFRQAVLAANDVEGIKKALLGTAGRKGKAATRGV